MKETKLDIIQKKIDELEIEYSKVEKEKMKYYKLQNDIQNEISELTDNYKKLLKMKHFEEYLKFKAYDGEIFSTSQSNSDFMKYKTYIVIKDEVNSHRLTIYSDIVLNSDTDELIGTEEILDKKNKSYVKKYEVDIPLSVFTNGDMIRGDELQKITKSYSFEKKY